MKKYTIYTAGNGKYILLCWLDAYKKKKRGGKVRFSNAKTLRNDEIKK